VKQGIKMLKVWHEVGIKFGCRVSRVNRVSTVMHVFGAEEPGAAKDQLNPSLQRLLQKGPEGVRFDTEVRHSATMAR
jgi:hypothetical protein